MLATMRNRLNEDKVTQAAAMLLRLRGGRMSYMKLIKLLYYIDREAIRRWGRLVSNDRHVSMDHGPVLSGVYNLITEEPDPNTSTPWTKHISPPVSYEVELRADPGTSQLSKNEIRLIEEVFQEHGFKGRWKIIDEVHQLPEWKYPDGSAIPITLSEMMRAVGKRPDEIRELEEELDHLAAVDLLFQP